MYVTRVTTILMSKRQYLKTLNREIQKLNGIIDLKIVEGRDYRRESLRHKKLLREVRREEVEHTFVTLFSFLRPSWF